EKRVMRAAFDAGFPTIVIMENGFTPLSKPHGEQFEACAKGKLLMLSPWEHHNEKRKITAEQCQQMNLMAMEICGQLKKE
ncbi:MAG: transposase, partial [Prevotella sp.]|nr:transposase [Prevotella sp.]